MKILLTFFLISYLGFIAAAQTSKRGASPVTLTSTDSAEGTTYSLVLSQEDGTKVSYWSRTIPGPAGKSYMWCRLIDSDANAKTAAALIELNEFIMLFVRYEIGTGITVETTIPAGDLLRRARTSGGRLSVKAPDNVVFTVPSGSKDIWAVKDGSLVDAEGKLLSEGDMVTVPAPE